MKTSISAIPQTKNLIHTAKMRDTSETCHTHTKLRETSGVLSKLAGSTRKRRDESGRRRVRPELGLYSSLKCTWVTLHCDRYRVITAGRPEVIQGRWKMGKVRQKMYSKLLSGVGWTLCRWTTAAYNHYILANIWPVLRHHIQGWWLPEPEENCVAESGMRVQCLLQQE